MRKFASKIDELRKEMCDTILSAAKEQVGEIDDKHIFEFDDRVYLDNTGVDVYSVTDMVMNEDGDFVLYCEDDEVGSYLDQSTDVLAEIADLILDGNFEYVEI